MVHFPAFFFPNRQPLTANTGLTPCHP